MKRAIVLFLLILLTLSLLTVSVAADRSVTVSEAVNWLKSQTYSWFDLDGNYGAQCSDFVSAYMNWLVTGDPYSGTYGVYNASYYTTVAGWDTSRWEIIKNYDALVPNPGDIFVSNGHTGVVIESYGNKSALIVDQNARNGYGDNGTYSWVHEVTWRSAGNGAYGANYFIRYRHFTSHVHSYNSVVTAPTCTKQGYTTHKCSCGNSYVDTYVKALGHNYVASVVKPTCTTEGYTTHKCSRCKASFLLFLVKKPEYHVLS